MEKNYNVNGLLGATHVLRLIFSKGLIHIIKE